MNCVKEHFGTEASGECMRIILRIIAIPAIRLHGKLVGTTVANLTHRLPAVKAAFNERLREIFK